MEEQKEKKKEWPALPPMEEPQTALPEEQKPPLEEGTTSTARERLERLLRKYFGEDFSLDEDESLEILTEFVRRNQEQNESLVNALERDPRLAQLLSDVLEGKRNAPTAMARYFGSDYMSYADDSPEYEQIMAADEERRAEAYELSKERRRYEDNLKESCPVIEEFCRSQGYKPEDFMNEAWGKLILPVLSGEYSQKVCEALDHAIFYEQDVEDAFSAGDIKGRNTNIERLKRSQDDGLPKGLTAAPLREEQPPRRGNPLIESALQA